MNNDFLYNAYINYLNIPINVLKDINIKTKTCQIIGMYDNKLKIWFNGWATLLNIQNKDMDPKRFKLNTSKDLLLYGLNIDIIDNSMIKSIVRYVLTSSKIYINDKNIQLDIILSIIIYLGKIQDIILSDNEDVTIYYTYVN